MSSEAIKLPRVAGTNGTAATTGNDATKSPQPPGDVKPRRSPRARAVRRGSSSEKSGTPKLSGSTGLQVGGGSRQSHRKAAKRGSPVLSARRQTPIAGFSALGVGVGADNSVRKLDPMKFSQESVQEILVAKPEPTTPVKPARTVKVVPKKTEEKEEKKIPEPEPEPQPAAPPSPAPLEPAIKRDSGLLNKEQQQKLLFKAREQEANVAILQCALDPDATVVGTLGHIGEATREMLSAESVRVFLVDDVTGDLYESDKKALNDRLARSSIVNRNMNIRGRRVSTFEIATNELNNAPVMVLRCKVGQGLVGMVAQTKSTIRLEDAQNSPLYTEEDRKADRAKGIIARNIMVSPVVDRKGRLIGVLQATNKIPGVDKESADFEELDQDLLKAVKPQVAAALAHRTTAVQLEINRAKAAEVDEATRTYLGAFMHLRTRIIMNLDSDTTEASAPSGLLLQRAHLTGPHNRTGSTQSDMLALHDSVALSLPKAISTVKDLFTWHYNPFNQTHEQLKEATFRIFDFFSLMDNFSMDPAKMRNFITDIHSNYHDTNPYHNFRHGFSVLHVVFMMLIQSNVMQYLSQRDVCGLLIAALCHDVDHPGYNNTMVVNMLDKLAVVYNDQAVLENHHASLTFRLLVKPENAILEASPKETLTHVRAVIIDAILATDMAEHFDLIQEIQDHLGAQIKDLDTPLSGDSLSTEVKSNAPSSSSGVSISSLASDEEDLRRYDGSNLLDLAKRKLLLRALCHSADIGNPVQPLELNKIWADKILAEFNRQARIEKKKGLPVSQFMVATGTEAKAKLNSYFIEHVASPLWRIMAGLMPELPVLQHLRENLKYWNDVLKRFKDGETEEEVSTTSSSTGGLTTSANSQPSITDSSATGGSKK